MLPHTPNTTNANTSWIRSAATASNTNVKGHNNEAVSNRDLAPNLYNNHVVIGKLINCPAGKAKSTNTKTCVAQVQAIFISGIRLAQVEKINPETKKKALIAIRNILGCMVNAVFIIRT